MKFFRIAGLLAAAALVVSSFSAQAQIQPHRVPAYTGKAQARPVRSSTSYSSSSAAGGAKIGVRAGLNVSDWSGDAVNSVMDLAGYTNGAVTKEMKPGFHAGLYATLPLGPRFAIEPGVFYSEKGTVLTGRIPLEQFDFLNARVKATARMAYLDIPLVAKAYLTDGFYLYAGPQASVLLAGKARVNASALGFSAFNQDFDIKEQFRPVDFSVTGGLGYQSQSGLGVSAGYDYGLSSLDKNNNFDAQNRVIKASINYSF
ncbi:porin family protein [Hymenobacter mucosus]|uniref:Outer membrane protein beta-barrel domain-containing protein n=1 Tax=Hymenobacter mucosus TaxID=1411120 RepID=A0A238WVD4_9BACT|nr:porin family protein [Hymenobacter mucosus]SNR50507.1 Outer membrane protein beta-barrel domain-containing protein [Hymenobacter mucosus]